MTEKEEKKLMKEYKEFRKELEHSAKKAEKGLAIYTRPFSPAAALGVYINVLCGSNKRVYENGDIVIGGVNTGRRFIQYSSGNYEVHSVHNPAEDRYFTQITYNPKNLEKRYYAYRQMDNKIVQRLLHAYGKRISNGK